MVGASNRLDASDRGEFTSRWAGMTTSRLHGASQRKNHSGTKKECGGGGALTGFRAAMAKTHRKEQGAHNMHLWASQRGRA